MTERVLSQPESPLLSVIIPTRERAGTLRFTIATALEQRSGDFEILVSDNASGDRTKDVVGAFEDPRLRYFNTGERISMCGNYEFALERARGTYVLYIGDDDAVIPGALDDLLDALARCVEPTIHMWPLHTYDWPTSERSARVAYLAPTLGRSELELKPKALDVIAKGGWKYYELPSPYHAAIPRALLAAIRQRTGRVFHSTQPDVFTALAIPAFADRAVNLGYSVSFNGRSTKSNGLGFIDRTASENIDRFLKEYGDYRFHPTLPASVGGRARMIPDAVLVARELFPELYSSTPFNYEAMWAFMCRLRLIRYLDVLKKFADIRSLHSFRWTRFVFYSLFQEAAVCRRKAIHLLLALGRPVVAVPDNILEFSRTLLSGSRAAVDRGGAKQQQESG